MDRATFHDSSTLIKLGTVDYAGPNAPSRHQLDKPSLTSCTCLAIFEVYSMYCFTKASNSSNEWQVFLSPVGSITLHTTGGTAESALLRSLMKM
jgi:hypothetical protein